MQLRHDALYQQPTAVTAMLLARKRLAVGQRTAGHDGT